MEGKWKRYIPICTGTDVLVGKSVKNWNKIREKIVYKKSAKKYCTKFAPRIFFSIPFSSLPGTAVSSVRRRNRRAKWEEI